MPLDFRKAQAGYESFELSIQIAFLKWFPGQYSRRLRNVLIKKLLYSFGENLHILAWK